MSSPQPACSQCSSLLPEALLRAGQPVACPACKATLEVEVFPALVRPQARGLTAERVLVEGEAGCFYHPEKRAIVPCDGCGRFLCALCDVELTRQHFCPNCLLARRDKQQMPELVNSRVLFDGAALVLAVASSLLFCMWFFWIVSAPLAIFLAVLSWTKPGSLLPRTRVRAILAIVLAVLQFIGFFVVLRMFYLANTEVWRLP